MLASSSLHARQPQLLINYYFSGLLECMLQVSLGTQFRNATLLRGKSDIPQSIQLKFWMKPSERLWGFEPFVIFVTFITYGGVPILGSGRRVVQGCCGVGRRGLLKVLALMLRGLIARICWLVLR